MAIKKQAGLVSGGTLTTEEWKAEQQLGGCMNARHRSSCQSRSSLIGRATNLRAAKYWTISSLTWIVYNSATIAHAAHAVGAVDNLDGEFDPGSGETLAACLTHARRTPCFGEWSGGRASNDWEPAPHVGRP